MQLVHKHTKFEGFIFNVDEKVANVNKQVRDMTAGFSVKN